MVITSLDCVVFLKGNQGGITRDFIHFTVKMMSSQSFLLTLISFLFFFFLFVVFFFVVFCFLFLTT
uniref:Uncharacterized protein n=1 Tax=Anguilla anguilla TaxID=7936 RepID=A0A0E9QW06_ANGAN